MCTEIEAPRGATISLKVAFVGACMHTHEHTCTREARGVARHARAPARVTMAPSLAVVCTPGMHARLTTGGALSTSAAWRHCQRRAAGGGHVRAARVTTHCATRQRFRARQTSEHPAALSSANAENWCPPAASTAWRKTATGA